MRLPVVQTGRPHLGSRSDRELPVDRSRFQGPVPAHLLPREPAALPPATRPIGRPEKPLEERARVVARSPSPAHVQKMATGRPNPGNSLPDAKRERLEELLRAGTSIKRASRIVGVVPGTARACARRLGLRPPEAAPSTAGARTPASAIPTDEKKAQIISLLRAGNAIRKVAELANCSRDLVRRCMAGLQFLCPCGRDLQHPGGCSHRCRPTEARSAALAKQRAARDPEKVRAWAVAGGKVAQTKITAAERSERMRKAAAARAPEERHRSGLKAAKERLTRKATRDRVRAIRALDEIGAANTKTVTLRSGGAITVFTAGVDPAGLSKEDRMFIFEMLEHLERYERQRGRALAAILPEPELPQEAQKPPEPTPSASREVTALEMRRSGSSYAQIAAAIRRVDGSGPISEIRAKQLVEKGLLSEIRAKAPLAELAVVAMVDGARLSLQGWALDWMIEQGAAR